MGELLDESTLDADVALAEQLAELEERIRRATAEEGRERAAIEALAALAAGLDMPLGYLQGTERAAVDAGCSCPAALDMAEADAALGAAAPEAQLFRVSDDRSAALRAARLPARGAGRRAWRRCRPLGFNAQ